MEKILREILTDDRALIFRNNELLVALEKKVPPNLRREFSAIKIALKLNVGRFFAVTEDDYVGKYRVILSLIEGGLNEDKINSVLKTFARALSTDAENVANSAEIARLQNRIAELEEQLQAKSSACEEEIVKDSPRKFIWDSDELFVAKSTGE